VGGQVLLSLLLLPVLRRRLPDQTRAPLTREIGLRFGLFTIAVFLPVQVATGVALAAHRGVTLASLRQPGYERTLGEKRALFGVVPLLSGGHGVAVGRGRDRACAGHRHAARSGGVVLLATMLVPT
jgi:hypothetical protein